MSEYEDDSFKSLICSICKPVQASPDFKQSLIDKALQREVVSTAGKIYSIGLSPVLWVTMAIIIALVMIIYGMHSIPNPTSAVYSLPFN